PLAELPQIEGLRPPPRIKQAPRRKKRQRNGLAVPEKVARTSAPGPDNRFCESLAALRRPANDFACRYAGERHCRRNSTAARGALLRTERGGAAYGPAPPLALGVQRGPVLRGG